MQQATCNSGNPQPNDVYLLDLGPCLFTNIVAFLYVKENQKGLNPIWKVNFCLSIHKLKVETFKYLT